LPSKTHYRATSILSILGDWEEVEMSSNFCAGTGKEKITPQLDSIGTTNGENIIFIVV